MELLLISVKRRQPHFGGWFAPDGIQGSYDSAGVAILDNGKINRECAPWVKSIIWQPGLKNIIVNGHIGLAAIRAWVPRHGGVTEENAHPHKRLR